jgi:sulfur transfer protein SufE
MTKKNKNQKNLVVSEFFEEAENWEQRYKALKKTMKNLRKFTEAKINGPGAEA